MPSILRARLREAERGGIHIARRVKPAAILIGLASEERTQSSPECQASVAGCSREH